MTEVTKKAGRNQRRWWRVYVHKIQLRLATLVGVTLLIYLAMIFGLAMIGPSLRTLVNLPSAPFPLSERAQMAWHLAFGGAALPPGIITVFVLGAIWFSFYLTHRFAGPLYRFELSAKEWAQGNLALRVRLRRGDDLQELADSLNQALNKLDRAFGEIRDSRARQQKALVSCLDERRARAPGERGKLDQLELLQKEGEQVDAVLKRFGLSDPY